MGQTGTPTPASTDEQTEPLVAAAETGAATPTAKAELEASEKATS